MVALLDHSPFYIVVVDFVVILVFYWNLYVMLNIFVHISNDKVTEHFKYVILNNATVKFIINTLHVVTHIKIRVLQSMTKDY